MARKRYTAEQIIIKLREADALIAQNKSVAEVVRQLGVAPDTYHRWRKEYGGMRVVQRQAQR